MKNVLAVQEAIAGIPLADLPSEAANSFLIEVCDHVPLRLHKMGDLKSLMLSWRSFSRWGSERVSSSLAFKGGQFLGYDYLQPIATQITQHATLKIIDAMLTFISRMGKGACLSIF